MGVDHKVRTTARDSSVKCHRNDRMNKNTFLLKHNIINYSIEYGTDLIFWKLNIPLYDFTSKTIIIIL